MPVTCLVRRINKRTENTINPAGPNHEDDSCRIIHCQCVGTLLVYHCSPHWLIDCVSLFPLLLHFPLVALSPSSVLPGSPVFGDTTWVLSSGPQEDYMHTQCDSYGNPNVFAIPELLSFSNNERIIFIILSSVLITVNLSKHAFAQHSTMYNSAATDPDWVLFPTLP